MTLEEARIVLQHSGWRESRSRKHYLESLVGFVYYGGDNIEIEAEVSMDELRALIEYLKAPRDWVL